jgi:hypothetical protein
MALAGAGVTVATSGVQAARAAAPAGASRYVAITPERVMDTRIGLGGTRLGPQQAVTLTAVTPEVAGAAGVAVGDVTAIVANLTSAGASGAGYFTIWPGGQPQPPTSSLNAERAGQTLANLATVPVGPGGTVQIFSQTGGEVALDVQGVYAAAGASATAGRLVSFAPRRALDSRETGGTFLPGEQRFVDLTAAGVPATASAAVLNVTATDSLGPGFLTLWSPAASRPFASNLNVDAKGQTVANQVIAAVDAGRVGIFSSGGTQVVVDVSGYVTGSADASSADGLFVPLTPDRLVDSRDRAAVTHGLRPYAGAQFEVPVLGVHGVPPTGVAAAALNVTLADSVAAGFVTAFPARTARPTTSVLNADHTGQTISNHVVTAVTASGITLFTQSGAHLVVDVFGYWTGSPLAETEGPPPPYNPLPPQPPAPPTHGTHAFSAPRGNSGARWNPCATIRYVVNDDHATPAQRALLEEALNDVTAATGIVFEYVGETSEGLHIQDPPAGADAILAFSTPALTPEHLGGGRIGVGGGSFSGSGRILDGFIIVDATQGSGATMRGLLRHELGHMMGLAHVGDSNELMYPVSSGRATYGPGDLEGLWWLGAAQGCLTSAFGNDVAIAEMTLD